MAAVYTMQGILPPAIELNLAEVNEMMDLIKIRQTQISQAYCDMTQQAEDAQKAGYLNLAKARYVQGPNSLTKSRLPTENSEESRAVVGVDVELVDEIDQIDQSTLRYTRREMEVVKNPAAESKLLTQIGGALPPACVKDAQKNFRKAMELHIERVNIQEELAIIEKKYDTLANLQKKMVEHKIYTVGGLVEARLLT